MPEAQQLLIAGEWRDAQSGATHDVINSYSGEAVTTQAAAGEADVNAVVRAAAQALPEVGAARPRARRPAGQGRRHPRVAGESIAAAVSEETAGTFGWGMFNVGLAAGMFRAAGAVAEDRTEDTVETVIPGLRSRAVRAPLGVCVGIAPWNAPVILGTRAVVWPLAFGNTVVLKASEQSPRVHGAIVAASGRACPPARSAPPPTTRPTPPRS